MKSKFTIELTEEQVSKIVESINPKVNNLTYSITGASKELGVSKSTMHRLIKQGFVRSQMMGKSPRITLEEINRFKEGKTKYKDTLDSREKDRLIKILDDYVSEWKVAFSIMDYNSIDKVGADFLESYTNYDLTVLEKLEVLFPSKIDELNDFFNQKALALISKPY